MNQIANLLLQGILTSLLVVSITIVYSNIKQEKEHKNKSNENLKIYYNTEYLSKDVKESRKRLLTDQHISPELKNQDLYTISIALQRIGIMIYIGGIDLSFAILMNGFQILSDWILIHEFVYNSLRNDEESVIAVPCERRHAEWFVLILYQYLYKSEYSKNADKKRLLENFENLYRSSAEIIKKEKLIFEIDKNFVCPHTKKLVYRIRRDFYKVCG